MREAAAEVLRRVRDADGRLLRAEWAPLGPGGGASAALRLTFDVGRVVLRAGSDGPGGLEAELGDEEAGEGAASEAFELADEEEPWWRLLGQPLTAVEPRGPEERPDALLLQFRREGARPRRVELVSERGAVAVRTAR